MKNRKRKLASPKFKLEYLREIDKNLMLHATQPKEELFNRLSAPPVVLRRIIYLLGTLTRSYKDALAMQLRMAKRGHRPGDLEYWLGMVQEMNRSLKRHRA